MFSYFEKGIKDTTPSKIIDFPTLVNTIRTNPHRCKIETIRELKKRGDNYYKGLKETLPNITPNCLVRERSLKDEKFDTNFTAASGYIYIDIDKVPNVQEYKKCLIEKYSCLASLICISTGGDGISMLFKVTNPVTKDNFDNLRTKLIETILKDEKIDPNASGLGRAMYISYDPDVFVNYDNTVTLDIGDTNIEKSGNHPNSYSSYNRLVSLLFDSNEIDSSNTINTGTSKIPYSRYHIYPIDEVLSNITTHTLVPVLNPVVDFKSVDYVEVYIPRIITDNNKHRIFFKMIHQLYYLNPDINLDYLFSFMFYINNTRAKPRMEMKELVRFFNSVVGKIKSTGEVYSDAAVKREHFNPSAGISKNEKQVIAAQLNGAYTRSVSIGKIINAKEQLQHQKQKITKRAVARLTGLDEKTVGKHFNAAAVDMDYEVSLWN